MDIDRIVERHDSAYINGQKHMFATIWHDEDIDESDEEDDEADGDADCEMIYTGTDGQEWTIYLTRSEYEHALTLSDADRIRYFETLEEL